MKKIISLFMSLALVLGIVSSMFLTVGAKVEQDPQPSINGEAVEVLEYTKWRSIDGNEASEISFDGPRIIINRKPDTLSLNAGVEVDFEPVDATGKQFFEFWIHTSDVSETLPTNIGFRIYTEDGTAADIYASNGKVDYYLCQNGKWVKNAVASNFCFIPEGYDGYVRVDLDQFGSNVPSYCGNGKVLNDSKINHINFWFAPTEEQEGNDFLVSGFRFVNANDVMEVVDIPDEEVVIPKMPEQPEIKGDGIKPVEDISKVELIPINEGSQELSVVDSDGEKLVKIRNLRYSGAEPGFAVKFDPLDVSDKQFLEFWIDTTLVSSDVAPVKLGVRLFDSDGAAADVYAANFLVDYYLLEDGEWECYFVDGSRCSLPAGYKGFFRLDISQFVDAVSDYCGNGNTLDLSKVNEMWIFYNAASAQYNKSTYIGGIRFVNSTDSGEAGTKPADSGSTTNESGTTADGENTSADTDNGTTEDDGKSDSTVWIIAAVAAAVVIAAVIVAVVLKKKKSN